MAAELVTVHYVLEGFVDISDSVDGLVVGDSELDGAVDRPGMLANTISMCRYCMLAKTDSMCTSV